MGQESFQLDTSSFADSANAAKKLAETLADAIEDCDTAIDNLYFSWAGMSRNEFEKKYHIFERQVKDIKTGLWDLYEDIVDAEEAYIQMDVDMAKEIEGSYEDYRKSVASQNP